MLFLSSKIFHRLPLVKSVVKFQFGLGDPKSLANSIFCLFSIKIRNLAPDSALGAEHFKHCAILGYPTIVLKHAIEITFLKNRFSILATIIRFVDIEDSAKMVQVLVALHNFIVMNCTAKELDVPPAFVNQNENQDDDEEVVNDELPEELSVMATNEKLMWMIEFGEI